MLVTRMGIVRVIGSPFYWEVLNNATHQSTGIVNVFVAATGRLVISFEPLTTIASFMVGMDEAYSKSFTVGASVGLDSAILVIRNYAGYEIPASDPRLHIASSNIQFCVWGT